MLKKILPILLALGMVLACGMGQAEETATGQAEDAAEAVQRLAEFYFDQEVIRTFGDWSYTLDKDGEATILSVPAAGTEGILLIPTELDGHPVRYLDVSELPEEVRELLTPPRGILKNTNRLTHEIIEYGYLDYEWVMEYKETGSPYVFTGPEDLVIRHGDSYRYAAGGKREKLKQDYDQYPSSLGERKIRLDLYADDVTLYTSGLYTYFRLSADTICLAAYHDRNATKVVVPETVDGMTVTAMHCLPGTWEYSDVLFVPDATEIVLPSTLKVLGKNSLYSSKLKSLKLPEGLEEIGDGAIGAWKIKKLTLPSTLKTLGSSFMHIAASDLVIPDSVTRISPHAFDDLYLNTVTLPAGLEVIPEGLFKNKQDLKTVTLPASVKEIGRDAFRGSRIKSVKFEKGSALKVIGPFAFAECPRLSKFSFPEGLEEIGNQAFYGCKKLTKLTLPQSLRKIGYFAFGECTGLKAVTLGANLEEIDPSAFEDGAKKLTITAPAGSYAETFAKENGYGFKKGK